MYRGFLEHPLKTIFSLMMWLKIGLQKRRFSKNKLKTNNEKITVKKWKSGWEINFLSNICVPGHFKSIPIQTANRAVNKSFRINFDLYEN